MSNHSPRSRRGAGWVARAARRSLAIALGALGLAALVAASAPASTAPPARAATATEVHASLSAMRVPPSVRVEVPAPSRRDHKAARPRVALFTATPAALPASGGTVHLRVLVIGAQRCRFSAAGGLAGLPVTRSCASGVASVVVNVPRNVSTSKRTHRFYVTVTGARGSAGSGPVTVLERAAPPPSQAPLVTLQPVGASAVAGNSVTFKAAASGRPTPSVQWEVSTDGGAAWTNVAGARAASYTLAVSASQSGNEYRALFSNAVGASSSRAATLTVTAAPVVTEQPTSANVADGAAVTFSAAASGIPAPSVQWQLSTDAGAQWAAVAGASATSYTFTATAGAGGTQYRALFTNALGSSASEPATLTVVATQAPASAGAPTVTEQPASQTVAEDDDVTFSAAASGIPAPTVQWQLSSNAGASWVDLAGATSTSYEVVAANLSQNDYQYRAVFTNPSGSVDSSAATLTVLVAPSVTLQPAGASVSAGANVTFSAGATGIPTPTVQWQVSQGGGPWGNIAGATSASYSFTAIVSETGFEYRAVFTNPAGSATTDSAALTVSPASSSSGNWSGWVATGSSFSAVSGSWTVPSVACNAGETAYSAQWTGIDGNTSATVEQTGTEADCQDGAPTYSAWYEMYGDAQVNDGNTTFLSSSSYPVAAGDLVTSTVSVAGDTWDLGIADATQGWTFDMTFPSPSPPPAQNSAEWIVERPQLCSYGCSLPSLADFGAVTFSAATATGDGLSGPISDFPAVAVNMASGSAELATAGPLDASGEQFTDTWDRG